MKLETFIFMLLISGAGWMTATADDSASGLAEPSAAQAVRVIKSPPEIMTRQRLPNFVGISRDTVGARGLSMNLVVIPPGGKAEPHSHKGFESAVYVLEGRVETRYGPGLKRFRSHRGRRFPFYSARCAPPTDQSQRYAGRACHCRA